MCSTDALCRAVLLALEVLSPKRVVCTPLSPLLVDLPLPLDTHMSPSHSTQAAHMAVQRLAGIQWFKKEIPQSWNPCPQDLCKLLLPHPVDMPLPVETTCLLHQAHGQLKRGGAEGIEFEAILDKKQISARELPQRIYRAQSCCRCQWMRRSLWTPCATCPLHRAHWQLIWLYRLLKECADSRRGAHRASVFALRDRFPHNPVAAASGRADPMGSHMSSAPSRWAK